MKKKKREKSWLDDFFKKMSERERGGTREGGRQREGGRGERKRERQRGRESGEDREREDHLEAPGRRGISFSSKLVKIEHFYPSLFFARLTHIIQLITAVIVVTS